MYTHALDPIIRVCYQDQLSKTNSESSKRFQKNPMRKIQKDNLVN